MNKQSFTRHIVVSSLAGTTALALAWAMFLRSMFSSWAVSYPGLVIIFLILALISLVPVAIHGGFSVSALISGAITKAEIPRSQLLMFLVLAIVFGALAFLMSVLLFGQKEVIGLQICFGGLLLSQILVVYFTIREDRRRKPNQPAQTTPELTFDVRQR